METATTTTPSTLMRDKLDPRRTDPRRAGVNMKVRDLSCAYAVWDGNVAGDKGESLLSATHGEEKPYDFPDDELDEYQSCRVDAALRRMGNASPSEWRGVREGGREGVIEGGSD